MFLDSLFPAKTIPTSPVHSKDGWPRSSAWTSKYVGAPMTSENPISEKNPAPNAGCEPNKEALQPNQNISPACSAPSSPPSKFHYEISCKQKKDWWDRLKPFVEIGGIALLAIYTGYTIKIYRANDRAATAAHDTLGEIQKQTTLIRQQLVGTQAAIINFNGPQWQPATNTLTFPFLNDGHITGTVTDFSATIQRKTFPGMVPIGTAISVGFPYHQVAGTGRFDFDKLLSEPLPQTDVSKWPGNEIVVFEGKWSWDDGFGDKSPVLNFCYFWIPRWHLDMPPGMSLPEGSGWGGGGVYGPQCDVSSVVSNFFNLKKKIAAAVKQHH